MRLFWVGTLVGFEWDGVDGNCTPVSAALLKALGCNGKQNPHAIDLESHVHFPLYRIPNRDEKFPSLSILLEL
jgi:hypothetical protein